MTPGTISSCKIKKNYCLSSDHPLIPSSERMENDYVVIADFGLRINAVKNNCVVLITNNRCLSPVNKVLGGTGRVRLFAIETQLFRHWFCSLEFFFGSFILSQEAV